MFTTMIRKIVGHWASLNIISDMDRDIYEYGLELILFSLINVVLIIITAAFIKRIPESIVLLAAVIPLQSCGGGYHATTHLRCFLIMYVGWWISMLLLPHISLAATVLILGIALVVIFTLAPVSNENVKMSDKQRKKMKNYVRIIAVSITIVSIVVYTFEGVNKTMSASLVLGMDGVALSMLASRFRAMNVTVKSGRKS